jgi:hypothetical protein
MVYSKSSSTGTGSATRAMVPPTEKSVSELSKEGPGERGAMGCVGTRALYAVTPTLRGFGLREAGVAIDRVSP